MYIYLMSQVDITQLIKMAYILNHDGGIWHEKGRRIKA